MNNRQLNLLKRLIVEENYQPIQFFAKDFKVSGKTLSKDLVEIDNVINSVGAWIEKKQGIGIKLEYTPLQLDKLNAILNNIRIPEGDRNLEYRRSKILLSLLINTDKYITIQKLSDKYRVSRTSINNDFNDIEQKLSKYNLKLSKTSKGTKVEGSEINIRKALVHLTQELGKVDPKYITEYQNIRRQEFNVAKVNSIMDEKFVSFFENLLNELEGKLKLVIYEPYYTNLLTHLVIMANRIINGNQIKDKTDFEGIILAINEKLYDSAIYLIRKIENKFHIKIDTEEVMYIYKYLTSIGLTYEDNEEKDNARNDLLHINFTKDLIQAMAQLSDINYDFNFSLYDRLLLHIKPMLNRIKYNIQINNPLLEDFLDEFEEQFIMIRVSCYLICKKYKINMISDHETAYILSYFISEVEKKDKDIRIKTLVICHSGYGSSQILATRLEKAFNNLDIVDIISSNSISNINLEEMDLMISTVELDIEKSYFMVSAFLSEIDKKNIKNYIDEIIKHRGKVHLDEEIKIINTEDVQCIDNDNLIYIRDNIYINLIYNKGNLVRRYKAENDSEIYIINYSNYSYLSRSLKQIIRKDKKDEY